MANNPYEVEIFANIQGDNNKSFEDIIANSIITNSLLANRVTTSTLTSSFASVTSALFGSLTTLSGTYLALSSDNVGIGTKSLSARLHVQGSISATSFTATDSISSNTLSSGNVIFDKAVVNAVTANNITFVSVTSIEFSTTGGLNVKGSLDVTGDPNHTFITRFNNSNSAVKFFISEPDGHVSITGNVNVSGSGSFSGSLSSFTISSASAFFGNVTADNLYITNTLSSVSAWFNSLTTTQGNTILAGTTGRVGIGTYSPSTTLHVYHEEGPSIIRAQGNGNEGALQVQLLGSVFELRGGEGVKFTQVNVGNRMVITNAGRVGIGTDGPIAHFQVTGSISASSITATNSISSNTLSSGTVLLKDLIVNVDISGNNISTIDFSSNNANISNLTITSITGSQEKIDSLTSNSLSSFAITSISANFKSVTSNNIFSNSVSSNSLSSVSFSSNVIYGHHANIATAITAGNIARVNNINYVWPTILGSVGSILKVSNFATGTLEWGSGQSSTGSASGKSYIVSPADKPPSVSSSLDDEFWDSTLDAKWTQLSWSPTTSAYTKNSILIFEDFTNTAMIRGLVQTPVDSTYNIVTKLTSIIPDLDHKYTGLLIYNTTNGRAITYGPQRTTTRQRRVTKWGALNSFSAFVFSESMVYHEMPTYYKIEKSSNSAHFYTSTDGIAWKQDFSEALSGFIESSGTIDRVGVFLVNQNATIVSGNHHWFRYDWTADFDPNIDN